MTPMQPLSLATSDDFVLPIKFVRIHSTMPARGLGFTASESSANQVGPLSKKPCNCYKQREAPPRREMKFTGITVSVEIAAWMAPLASLPLSFLVFKILSNDRR